MLRTQNLCWEKKNKTILKDIDFSIQQGECVGIVGPNGSGKSSLLKILAFLETSSNGDIWFKDKQIPKKVPLDIRRRIAIVFQDALLLNTSVWENVAAGLKIRSLSKAEIQKRVFYWLEQFGIASLAKQRAHTLSGGEAQRVSLARAFAMEPEILFLDEPFSALDAPTKEGLRKDLANIFNETKVTTIIVSHDFEDIERLTHRAVVILNGKICANAAPEKLLSEQQTNEVDDFLSYWRKNQILGSL